MASTNSSISENKVEFPNDAFQVEAPCLENFLEGIPFWSKHTPSSTALLFPRTPASQSMEDVKWIEFRVSRSNRVLDRD